MGGGGAQREPWLIPLLPPWLSNLSELATSSDVPLLQEASLTVPTRRMPSWALLWVPRVGLSASDLLPLTLTSLRATATWGLFL